MGLIRSAIVLTCPRILSKVTATAAGWGKTLKDTDGSTGIVQSAILQKLEYLPIMSNAQCLKQYENLFRINLSRELR